MPTLYNLDNAINSFFASKTSVTRQQCDDLTRCYAGGQVNPVQIQGAFSYTVTAGFDSSKLFQFRTHDSSIDLSIAALAEATHAEFVALVRYHGTIGTDRPLHIYEMDKLDGIPYIMARDISRIQPPDSRHRQQNTVKDLARFFAQSWNNRQELQEDRTQTLLAKFDHKFSTLIEFLPPRFKSSLVSIRKDLPSIFSGALPFVLSHGDLCEMNMLVDPQNGKITGIVDWAEARILPFGFSLWGFENILGFMDSEGWHYYDNRKELEDLFWNSFRAEIRDSSYADLHLIQSARIAGLFCRYGFVMNDMAVASVVNESNTSAFAYLNAFCTAVD